jgi:hypothetical protein
VYYHCIIPTYGSFRIEENTNTGVGRYDECVLANEQQRQRMYDKIKCSGYKYNRSINKLEKIDQKFKDGDIVATLKGGQIFIFKENAVNGNYCFSGLCYFGYNIQENKLYKEGKRMFSRHATEEEKEKLFNAIKDNGYKWNKESKTLEKLPKFKVGEYIVNDYCMGKVIALTNDAYLLDTEQGIPFSCEHNVRHWTIQDAKNGDVLYHSDSASNGIFIFKELLEYEFEKKVICYCDYDSEDGFCLGENHTCCWADSKIIHPATEKQRNLLFQKMKEAGYKWNPETRTLEKLVEPKFKVGDIIVHKENRKTPFVITEITKQSYKGGTQFEVLIEQQDNFELVPTIVPKFKVGDRIKSKYNNFQYDVKELTNTHYTLVEVEEKFKYTEPIIEDKNWELVPNKFDINTLKPFAEVLVRNTNNGRWRGQFYMSYDKNEEYPFECAYNCWKQCIPYKNNEHLFNKTDDCDNYYKNWE